MRGREFVSFCVDGSYGKLEGWVGGVFRPYLDLYVSGMNLGQDTRSGV